MILLTPPTSEPVTPAEAALAARVDDITAHDAIIPGLITAARQMAEQATGRRFMAQTWRHELHDWPSDTCAVPLVDATAVAVSYWDGTAWQTLDASAIEWGQGYGGTLVGPAWGTSWPTLGDRNIGARVRIDVTVGATDPIAVPEVVKLYIKSLVTHWLDHPGAAPQGGRAEVDPIFDRLLDSQRFYG